MKLRGRIKMKIKVIHKKKLSRYIIAEESLCGRWIQYHQAHYHWREVNCKKCLRYRKPKLNEIKEKE